MTKILAAPHGAAGRASSIAGAALLAIMLTAVPSSVRAASETTGMSDAFKGFGSNTKEPVQIDADTLEVLDKDQNAVFSGNVHVRQKDTVMKTLRLKVFYEGKAGGSLGKAPAPAAAGSPADQQQIRRLEAEGRVLINQKDQTVVGDKGWFDMKTQTAQIDGDVILTQGKNVARGKRLTVDLKTGQYKLDGGRVQLILDATQQPGGKPAGQ